MSNIHFISLAALPAEQVHSILETAVGAAIGVMVDAQLVDMMKAPLAEFASEAQPLALAA